MPDTATLQRLTMQSWSCVRINTLYMFAVIKGNERKMSPGAKVWLLYVLLIVLGEQWRSMGPSHKLYEIIATQTMVSLG